MRQLAELHRVGAVLFIPVTSHRDTTSSIWGMVGWPQGEPSSRHLVHPGSVMWFVVLATLLGAL